MIQGVAYKTKSGEVFKLLKPNRHKDLHKIVKSKLGSLVPGEDGFYTSNGEFLTRSDALVYAIKVGQLIGRSGNKKNLYSEDLW